MKIEYHKSRYMAEQVDRSFKSVGEAASAADYDLEYGEAWPLKIVADGNVVWENPGLGGEIIAESLKRLMPNVIDLTRRTGEIGNRKGRA